MPSPQELIGILIVVLVIWVILEMAQLAIRVILFVVALMLVVAVLYYGFVR